MKDLSIKKETESAIILCSTPDKTEMLKITKDGFFVRGVKVLTEDEPELVYNAFKDFLKSHNFIK